MPQDADVIVIGSGLSGLVAAADIAEAGRRVIIVDQEPEARIGGQAHWSFGGLFLVGTPEQRRLGIRDSHEQALADWIASAEFTDDDVWPRRWAEAYVDQAASELRPWLHDQGVRFFPVIQWPERGGYLAHQAGASAPRFHIVWGTGPGILEPFIRRVRAAADDRRVELRFRHRVTELTSTNGEVDGVVATSLTTGEDVELRAQAVIIASGGIGGNHDLVRTYWPREKYGEPPTDLLQGVPDHVDGAMLEVARETGANITNTGRMWNYPEAIPHHTPIWNRHAVRIIAGPSSLWLDAHGRRLPAPLFLGFDTLKALEHILSTGYAHSWLLTNMRIISEEFALSGSAHNPDLTNRDIKQLVMDRPLPRPTKPVQGFLDRSKEFIRGERLSEVVRGMNALVGEPRIDEDELRAQVVAYDRQIASGYRNDAQLAAIDAYKHYLPDRITRSAGSQRILDPTGGPIVAVRQRILTRKTLGGIQTDLGSRVLTPDGDPLPGLYAVGEVAGFGGGGVHGHRSLEGTFLGGCLVSGRFAARDLTARL